MNRNRTFKSSQKLKNAVAAQKACGKKGTTDMVRPIFRPLENGLYETLDKSQIAYENEDLVAIVPPDGHPCFYAYTELQSLKNLTPLEKAKLEIFKTDEDSLVMSLDTEYHDTDLDENIKRREILSYQVACYYRGRVFRLILFSKSEKLLSVADIVGVLYKSPIVDFSLPCYQYPIPKKNVNFPNGYSKELPDYPKGLSTYILSHNALADITTLADFPVFYKYLTTSLGIISKEAYNTHFTSDDNRNFYACLSVKIIDTMNHSPGSLEELGATKGIDTPKLSVPEGAYEDMTSWRRTHFRDFCTYGINDSDIILKWYLTLYKDLRIPATTTAMAAKAFQYFAFNDTDMAKINEKTRLWRGVVKDKRDLTFDTYYGGVSYRFSGEKGINLLADEIDTAACATYYGGLNSCMVPGFYDMETFDFDLCGAYPTAGAMLPDIDFYYEVPMRVFAPRSELETVDLELYPYNAFGFGTVDFEFPPDTKHPCIFVKHPEHGLIATLKGTNIMCTWCEVKTAAKMGAKIVFKNFKMYAPLWETDENGNKHVISSCAVGYKALVQNREITKQMHGKKSIMEITAKLINNGVYGKMGQAVQSSTMRNFEYNITEDKPPSIVSSAPHASYTTALVRCILCATMEQLERKGYTCFSVTTDGFITNAPYSVLESCDAYGLYHLFKATREFLLDNSDEKVWEQKHKQNYLLNITTRMNQGFDDMEIGEVVSGETVDAHVGYKGDDFTGAYMARSKKGVEFEVLKLPSLLDICYGHTDYVGIKLKKNIKANYDFKRKIDLTSLHNQELSFRGHTFFVPNFQTVPYETYEEYMKASECLGGLKYSILTAEEYNDIFTAMMTGTYKKRTPLKKQVDACLYHIRQDSYGMELIGKVVQEMGLQQVIWMFENTMKKSYEAYTKLHDDVVLSDWDYKLDKGMWRNLSRADRFRPENYTDLSEWLEKALMHNLSRGKTSEKRDLKQATEELEEEEVNLEI